MYRLLARSARLGWQQEISAEPEIRRRQNLPAHNDHRDGPAVWRQRVAMPTTKVQAHQPSFGPACVHERLVLTHLHALVQCN
ncbi:hypothetical protein ATY42_15000 [Xanthomonas oryzae pv. oryzae]|nr:hypothetical protein AZ54_08570 [Xanthomonas oryzae pv. oryzae PXO86]ALZ71434.1 hypothetical protein APZ20_07975 [Xanthomonas oryzae pv. oryzae]AOS03181.1 hypothetical protein ATY42_15000 [Xanthomonas oryzae pv. oryzae]AOS06558.1 hypothetical protein ATY43_11265 [Xanthomonas oryzae pv. oryzae]AOS14432.1 hypothetical protein ATY45_07810 [Xanthomonas oryzae pv. oryzae]